MVEKYCRHTWKEIKEFFLRRLTLTNDEKDYAAHHGIMDNDWGSDGYKLKSGGTFYKDALNCEYTYIFDLDSPVKRLMLFEGCDTPNNLIPYKGFRKWYTKYDSIGGYVYYNNYKGNIKGEMPLIMAQGYLYAALGKDEDTPDLKRVLEASGKDLPLQMDVKCPMALQILELKLKETNELQSSPRPAAVAEPV
jgi:hypothetical protein